MKIKFTCNDCSEQFCIESKYLVSKVQVQCPNCSQLFDPEVIDCLKKSTEFYKLALSKLPMKKDQINSTFDFLIID